ncbi:hypothetical protein ZWY2020_058138 [Hordeum vulgare]|nr:hypothetical protein ZWY2020_058138 [Hordeum vulgare]
MAARGHVLTAPLRLLGRAFLATDAERPSARIHVRWWSPRRRPLAGSPAPEERETSLLSLTERHHGTQALLAVPSRPPMRGASVLTPSARPRGIGARLRP